MPDFTQNLPDYRGQAGFNRYSYALNNPLKFTDPDGEWIHLIIGGAIGGIINWITHGAKFNADGLKYFGFGFLAGALGAGIGTGISAAMAGESFGAGFMLTSSTIEMATGFTAGSISGAGAGFAGGFLTEFSNSLFIEDKSFTSSISNGWNLGWKGAVGGAVIGGIMGGIDAVNNNRKFWTGQRSDLQDIKIGIKNNDIADVADLTKNNKEILETNVDLTNNNNPLIDVQPGSTGENIVTIEAPKGINSYTAIKGPSNGGIIEKNIINNGKTIQFTTFKTNLNVQLFGNRHWYMSINKGVENLLFNWY